MSTIGVTFNGLQRVLVCLTAPVFLNLLHADTDILSYFGKRVFVSSDYLTVLILNGYA